jgi:hypothetical protein
MAVEPIRSEAVSHHLAEERRRKEKKGMKGGEDKRAVRG